MNAASALCYRATALHIQRKSTFFHILALIDTQLTGALLSDRESVPPTHFKRLGNRQLGGVVRIGAGDVWITE